MTKVWYYGKGILYLSINTQKPYCKSRGKEHFRWIKVSEGAVVHVYKRDVKY